MPLFYQRGHILHFSRSFSILRQGSYLISLYPIFSPSFSELSLSFPPLSPSLIPVSSISCDVPEFSPSLLPRTLEKGAFLQSAVTVSSSIASQKLYWSSATASVIQLLRRSMIVMQSLQPIYYFLISRQKGILFNSAPSHSTPQHYRILLHYAYSPLHK